MFKNYLKIAVRNIVRYKRFSFINITGLALGLTACILIALFVWDERGYDKFLPEGDEVYRIYDEYSNNAGTQTLAVSAPMFATTLQKDFPEVEKTARVMMLPRTKTLFEAGKTGLYEESGFLVDSTFFELFPLQFKYGSPVKSLDDPSSIVLSEQMSQLFFGDRDPVGMKITMNKASYQVKGVYIKNPKFHLQFNYLVPLAAAQLPAERMQSWGWHQFFNYVKLKKGADVRSLELKFQDEVRQREKLASNDAASTDKPFFQALKDIHLYSAGFKFDMAERGNITYVKALIIIAVFILLIACFNFINLATAKSLQRAREVGVRKSLGAGRKELMVQFIGETVLLSCISMLIAVGLAMLALPWMNYFTGKNIPFSFFAAPLAMLSITGLTLVVGVVAGFYPALVLSGFKPAKVLKAAVVTNAAPGKIPWLRHGLVVTQFALSVLLIISATVVFRQVNYLHNKDLGFNKEQIMFFPMRGDSMFRNVDAFKNELLRSPGVSSVSVGYGFPGDAVAGDEIIVPRKGGKKTQSVTQIAADYDYVKTLGLEMIAGRDFSKDMQTDKDHAWIINEAAVEQLGFATPQQALGQDLYWHPWGAAKPDSVKTGKIIGVVKDFNYKSLYDKVEAAVIQIFPDAAWKVAVKIRPATIANTINAVRSAWNKFSPGYPLEYKFLDDNFEEMYKAEDKLKSLLSIFTALAIFIGCLGLFGLAAYAAGRRRKEIGIRKVLGASARGIVLLLSKDFIKLVVISLLIASPAGWYFMNKWLQNFAFRINISWWFFAVAGIIALGIAFITVSVQAIKAALDNPAESLRME